MNRALATLVIAAGLALGGCSAPAQAQPVSLKDSCVALNAVLTEFGQRAPDAAGYAAVLPKVQAIHDAGDQSTKDSMQPLVEVMARGAKGENVLTDQVSVTVNLAMACGAAGAPLGGGGTPTASPSPSPTAESLPVDDFAAAMDELDRTCSGDTCTASVRVGVGYVGVDDLDRAIVTVTISGGTQPETRSIVVEGDDVPTFETSVQVAKGGKLSVDVDRAETA